jgi:hypothetical protein
MNGVLKGRLLFETDSVHQTMLEVESVGVLWYFCYYCVML